MDIQSYQQARLSKDPRFDGVFFVAVKTTNIFCRPVCPAVSPKEQNVEYFETASEALLSGYRPCLRCRPESAPFSPAWNGTNTTVTRALNIIHQAGFSGLKLSDLAQRLGITDRYLRKLFEQQLGVSPKTYMQHQQILFAKALLHQTHLPIQQIAFACGYNNVRRFNDGFKRLTTKTPSQVRKLKTTDVPIRLQMNYQPPFQWSHWHQFVNARQIEGVEELGNSSYGRTFQWPTPHGSYVKGWFKAVHRPDKHGFNITIELNDIEYLYPITQKIRQIFDLNANAALIQTRLTEAGVPNSHLLEGIRIPGCWSSFEAGIRAILGQQVSVKAAVNLLNQLVSELGDKEINEDGQLVRQYFPTPQQVACANLSFLKIPNARKASLKALAKWVIDHPNADAEGWLAIKGIGPWTVQYGQMRGEGNSDIWLDTDLGIKKALDIFPSIDAEKAKPWRSYLTFTMWAML